MRKTTTLTKMTIDKFTYELQKVEEDNVKTEFWMTQSTKKGERLYINVFNLKANDYKADFERRIQKNILRESKGVKYE